MRVAVIGASGQLGTDLVRVFGDRAIAITHRDLEVTDAEAVRRLLSQLGPDAVVNTAAFHRVDACEEDPDLAWRVNALGARHVALACAEINAACVYVSTDYVFDGEKGGPYTEEDRPRPLNTYGITKLAGEHYTMLCPRHYVVRVASLFGAAGASGKGGNFVETMIKKARAGEPVRVVDDIRMSPTYTRDAARLIRALLENQYPYGVYHLANAGSCSWYEFASEIFRQLGLEADLAPISSEALAQKARRPRDSSLASSRLAGLQVRPWEGALRAYLEEKGYLWGIR
jgi:dTDP-4-dehydrorhamnose reductase